jgi:hypothetical protein
MTQLQKVLGIVATVLAILGGVGKYLTDAQQTAIARDRDREHLRVLEKIIVSEWPAWTPAIDWSDDR